MPNLNLTDTHHRIIVQGRHAITFRTRTDLRPKLALLHHRATSEDYYTHLSPGDSIIVSNPSIPRFAHRGTITVLTPDLIGVELSKSGKVLGFVRQDLAKIYYH